jgi:hypothetical protein
MEPIEPQMSMDVDSSVATSTDRDFPEDALTRIADTLRLFFGDGSDIVVEEALRGIHNVVRASTTSPPESLVPYDQFKKNATKNSASGFIDLLKEALKEEDLKFWRRFVTHGTSPDLDRIINCSFLNS